MARSLRHFVAALWLAAWGLASPCASAQAVAPAAAADDEPQPDEFWDDKNRGWFFYERKPKKVAPKPPPAPEAAAAPKAEAPKPAEPAKHPDLVRFEALQKRVEDTRNIAIVNPTESNLRAFLYAQHEALETASRFGEAAQRVVWATPEIDPSANGGRPTAADGMYLWDAEQDRRLAGKWAELKKTHAFFYFYRSDCPYCTQFAPQLKQFSQRSGIEILAIATDGVPTRHFPDALPDNGLAAKLGVQQVPALFLAEPRTGKVLPVGYGVIAPSDLERRVDLITRPEAEGVAPSTIRNIGAMAQR